MHFPRKAITLAASFIAGGLLCDKAKQYLKVESLKPYAVEAAVPPENTRPNEIMRYGFPSNSNVKIKSNYVMGYDNRLRNANWVFEHLNKDIVSSFKAEREDCAFTQDQTIHKFFRSTNKDYYLSGYDRGHLAAAANHRASQTWMEDTFSLSNIIPQNSFMNRKAWNNLEKFVRSLVYHCDNVYVCTGPLYLPRRENDGKMFVSYEVIGENHVAVPTHLFKVVVCQRGPKLELLSYIMPNEGVDPDLPLDKFLQPIEMIERYSGLIMFDRIPREVFSKINRGIETRL